MKPPLVFETFKIFNDVNEHEILPNFTLDTD